MKVMKVIALLCWTFLVLANFGMVARAVTQQTTLSLASYHLTLINLHPGTNVVPNFTPQGERGTVFIAYRGNGNAHGFTDYIFAVNNDIVGVQGSDPATLNDVTRAFPFDGEAIEKSVYLLKGNIGVHKGVFLVTAERELEKDFTVAASDHVKIRIFALQTNILDQIGAGSTNDVFEPLITMVTKSCYRSAQTALFDTLKFSGADDTAKRIEIYKQPCGD